MLAPSLVVLPETPGHEVRERDEVVLRHVLGHLLQRPGREAAAPGGREVEAERHGDEERGEADHHDDELLAEEGGQEAAAQEAAQEAAQDSAHPSSTTSTTAPRQRTAAVPWCATLPTAGA